jgi:hypothetical protein
MGAVRKAVTGEPTLPRLDGIDVSKWQGADRLAKGARLRDLVGGDAGMGPQHEGARPTVRSEPRQHDHGTLPAPVPLPRGGARPVTAQVTAYLNTIGQLAVGEGVMLNAEEPGVTVAMCVSWLQAVEAVTGIPSTVYTGGHVAGGPIWNSNVIFDGHRARFFAAYTSESEALVMHAQGKIWDAWQWTDKGKVAGVSTDVDCVQIQDGGARSAGVVRW